MKPVFSYLTIGCLVAGVVCLMLLFTPLGKRPLDALFPVGEVEPIDFKNLRLQRTSNQYLACPRGYCSTQPDAEIGEFSVPVEKLRDSFQANIAAESRVELLADQDGLQFDYVQRSARFRFPDVVTVRFISLSSSRSTLAIYSRSIYGKTDFGVNGKRIKMWLRKLQAAAK